MEKKYSGEGARGRHLVVCPKCPPVHYWSQQVQSTDFVCLHGLKPDINPRDGKVTRRKVLNISLMTGTFCNRGEVSKSNQQHTVTKSPNPIKLDSWSEYELDSFSAHAESPRLSQTRQHNHIKPLFLSPISSSTTEKPISSQEEKREHESGKSKSNVDLFAGQDADLRGPLIARNIIDLDSSDTESDQSGSEYRPSKAKKISLDDARAPWKPNVSVNPRTTRNRTLAVEIPRREQNLPACHSSTTFTTTNKAEEILAARVAERERINRNKAEGMDQKEWEKEMAKANNIPIETIYGISSRSDKENRSTNGPKEAPVDEASLNKKRKEQIEYSDDEEVEGRKKKTKARRLEEAALEDGSTEGVEKKKKKKKNNKRAKVITDHA